MLKKYKIVKVINSRFIKDNKSCKFTNLQEVLQLEEVKQEILTNNFNNSSKNKSCVEKDFEILLLNLLSLQNSLISLSLLSSPVAAN